MSEEMKVPVGIAVDAVNEGTIRTLKKIKTSMVNIRIFAKLEKQINEEVKLYQEAVNQYIILNGVGEGDKSKIDTSNPVARNAYIAHVMELRNSDSDILQMSKPIFSEKDFESKGIELSMEEVVVFNGFGITKIDLGLDDEENTEEISEKEEEKELLKE